jgi:hypothetical protein
MNAEQRAHMIQACNICWHYHPATEKCDYAYVRLDSVTHECSDFRPMQTPTLDHWVQEAKP